MQADRIMDLPVLRQIGRLGKGLATAREGAHEGLLASVHSSVHGEGGSLCEGSIAFLAFVRLVTSVSAVVLKEGVDVGELLAALDTTADSDYSR